MIARITNFASKENQMIEWDERIPKIIDIEWYDYEKELFNRLLGQFYILLDKYPDSLKDDVILKKYQELKKYAKENKTAISNCYSYYNKGKTGSSVKGNDKINSYGISIVPKEFYHTGITITSYNSTNGVLLSKDELKLKLEKDSLYYTSMMTRDSSVTFIYEKEKKLIKHL